MTNPFQFTTNDLQLFLLAWFRITGILLVGPIFGSLSIPNTLKAVFGFVFAMIFFPLVPRAGIVVEPNMVLYIVWVFLELGVGLLIGFAATLLFTAVQFGGQLIDQELGLSLANVIDPISNEQISVVGQFKLFLATIVYLMIDGHHFLLKAISKSFSVVPLLGIKLTDAAAVQITDTMIQDMFEIAVTIAAPAMVTLFLITIAMAFMARTVPEMNIFIIGFSVRLLVGFLVLVFGVSAFVYGFEKVSESHERSVWEFVTKLGG